MSISVAKRAGARGVASVLLFIGLASPSSARAQIDTTASPPIGVSPLLVDAASEVWGVITQPDNPIWPGWNASDTPLLLYLPGHQDLLINHPKPPDGFTRYDGPLSMRGLDMWVKNGGTIIDFDGQNTSRNVNGITTLVVADPLSNLRQSIAGLLEDPRPGLEKSRALGHADLMQDPYDQLALIVHEAFHVHQERTAPNKGANEMLLLFYPVLSVENNVGFALEGAALAEALSVGDDARFRRAAVRWLAVREQRRALLPARAIEYEDGAEFNEGLAKYTEYRLWQVLEGRTPSPGFARAQGFHGYRDLAPQRRELLRRMLSHMRGEVSVNNAPYGTAPVRMRFYYSGMALGALLDRLSPTWKRDLFTGDNSMTALARAALRATPEELAAGLREARADTAYAELLGAKQRLAIEGQKQIATRLAALESGSGTGLVIDYSALESSKVALAFTPFGLTRIDSVRTIFDQIPIRATFADQSELEEELALPLLRDTHKRELRLRLEKRVTPAELAKLAGAGRVGAATPARLSLVLPGVNLDLKNATLSLERNTIRVALKPAAK